MKERLDELLEIGAPESAPPVQAGPPVTLLARICQVSGWGSLIAALISFIPETSSGPLGITLSMVISFLGLILFGTLTVVFALAAMLRVWLSAGRFRGGVQVLISLAVLAVAVAVLSIGNN